MLGRNIGDSGCCLLQKDNIEIRINKSRAKRISSHGRIEVDVIAIYLFSVSLSLIYPFMAAVFERVE